MKTFIYRFGKKMQEKSEGFFDEDKIQVSEELDVTFGLEYKGDDQNVLKLDIYRPKKAETMSCLPVILMVHGGGLFMGDSKMEAGICQNYAGRGFLVFSLSYRLLTEAKACEQIADICAGFRFAEQLIPKYGGNVDCVCLAAESAGAFLSTYSTVLHSSPLIRENIGCQPSSLKIQKMIFFSGMIYTRRPDIVGLLYPQQIYGLKMLDPQFMRLMDPERPEVLEHLPPMILVSSDADFLRKHTLSFYKVLKKNNKPCVLMYYKDNKELTHAFACQKPYLKESLEVIDRTVRLLKGISV